MTSLNRAPSPARLSHDSSCLNGVFCAQRARQLLTALPIDPPIAGARTVLPARKTSQGESHLRGEVRDRNTCGTHVVDIVRIRQRSSSVQQPTHCKFHPQTRHRRRKHHA